MEKIILNEQRNVSLRVFLAENAKTSVGVLILPGGGYGFCSERESDGIAKNFVAENYSALVLHYSVGEYRSLENAVSDVAQVFSYIEQHPECGIEELIIIGFSAGGHLAALYSNTPGFKKPVLNILGYPCILSTMNPLLEVDGPSLDELVTEMTPATFIFATAADELVPIENSLAYASALNQADIPFEIHVYQEGHHGLSLGTEATADGDSKQLNPHYATWFPLCIEWINHNLEERQ